MSVNLSPIGNDAPFVDANGDPLNGGKLYWYVAGSSTPQDTYTTSLGNVANANPVILNSNGYPVNSGSVVEIWLTAGVNYKAALTDANDVPIWTRDNIHGINDTTVSQNEWVSGPAPTFISTTSFSLVGDQTSTFQVGRRVKTTNSGGTIYSTISASVFGAVTTVTVVNDSGVLDSGLSAVFYGLLSSTNDSISSAALSDYTTGTLASTFTFDGAGGTSSSVTMTWRKLGALYVDLNIPAVTATTGTGSTLLTSTTALPAAIRPVTQQFQPCNVLVNNAAASNTAGNVRVNTNGTISIQRDGGGTAFTNTASGGTATAFSIRYFIG